MSSGSSPSNFFSECALDVRFRDPGALLLSSGPEKLSLASGEGIRMLRFASFDAMEPCQARRLGVNNYLKKVVATILELYFAHSCLYGTI